MTTLLPSILSLAAVAITGASLLNFVVFLVIAGLIYWVVTWGLSQMSIAEPFATIIRVVLILAVVIFLINALLSLVGHPFISIG